MKMNFAQMAFGVQAAPRPISNVFDACVLLSFHQTNPNQPMIAKDATDVSSYYWKAFDNMLGPAASGDSWGILVASLNVAMVLAEMGYGRECVPELKLALDGAFRCWNRGVKTGRWGFDGPAIGAIREALHTHDAQLEHATRADIMLAMETIKERERNGDVYRGVEQEPTATAAT